MSQIRPLISCEPLPPVSLGAVLVTPFRSAPQAFRKVRCLLQGKAGVQVMSPAAAICIRFLFSKEPLIRFLGVVSLLP